MTCLAFHPLELGDERNGVKFCHTTHGDLPQEALKVNLIAPMALMQAGNMRGMWSFGVVMGQ